MEAPISLQNVALREEETNTENQKKNLHIARKHWSIKKKDVIKNRLAVNEMEKI